jgi:hypothetical protein
MHKNAKKDQNRSKKNSINFFKKLKKVLFKKVIKTNKKE